MSSRTPEDGTSSPSRQLATQSLDELLGALGARVDRSECIEKLAETPFSMRECVGDAAGVA